MSITVPIEGFGGGGGASLNFDVKAYATEALLLAAVPKENTIGVITTTPITGWIFSSAEPAETVEGMVWISTGTSSAVEFNALKKNAIQVYPLSAKQYVDGAWVDRTVKSYQDGKWVDWIRYLYNNGDTCDSVTGGWKAVGLATLGADCIELAPTSTTRYADACINEIIDLSSCSKVLFKLSGYVGAGGGGTNVIVWVHGTQILENRILPSTSYAAGVTINTSTQLEDLGDIEVNVELLDGEYYVGVHAGLGGSSSADRIDDVKLLEVRYE